MQTVYVRWAKIYTKDSLSQLPPLAIASTRFVMILSQVNLFYYVTPEIFPSLLCLI